MTAIELIRYEVGHIGFQLRKVLEGMPAEGRNQKITAESMTPLEMMEHLCEVYQAVITERSGGKHEWGSFALSDKSWENAWKTMWELRERASEATVGSEDGVETAHDYIVAHDAYHVGQLALMRMQADPEWNPHSIYPS